MKIEDFIQEKNEYNIIDTRSREAFLDGFIPNSVFLPIEKFSLLSHFINDNRQVIVVTSGNNDSEVVTAYEKLGLANKYEILVGGMEAWEEKSWSKDLIIAVESDEFAMDIKFDSNMMVVDVRSEESYNDGHVVGAQNVPLKSLGDIVNIANIDEEANVYIYCGGGTSAVIAASLIKLHGLHNVRVVIDGYAGIQRQSSVEIVKPKKQ